MTLPPLGFIGVGAMGGPMARHLLRAGYPLRAFDTDAERLAACGRAGAVGARSAAEVVDGSEVVLLSLPSSDAFVHTAEDTLLPHARRGQVLIDLGTTTPPETRRLAPLLAQRGATLIDAPVSGGDGGRGEGRAAHVRGRR